MARDKFLLRISEPTNKIPPKVPGKKYEGGEIVSVEMKATAYLLCQVTGFPAPMFRYFLFVIFHLCGFRWKCISWLVLALVCPYHRKILKLNFVHS